MYDCLILVYCLMPDHAHLIAKGISESADCLSMMKRFKQRFSFQLKQNGFSAELQKDFYDHIIGGDKDIDHQILYFANNPVRAGLVESAIEYPWTGSIGFDLRSVLVSAM